MAFVKLDSAILTSTLWPQRDCREVFITALLMAEPFEARQPMKQIEVDSLDHTGFEIPAGWYGMVPSAGVGIVRLAGIKQAAGIEALRKLGAPDLESRSQDFEGRRMIRVDGGYIIINFIKYRDRDHTSRERQKRFRERNGVTTSRNGVTSRYVTQAEAEAEAEKKKDKDPLPPPAPVAADPSREKKPRKGEEELDGRRAQALAFWAEVAVPAKLSAVLKPEIYRASLGARLKDPAWLDLFKEAVTYAAQHPAGAWMRGAGTGDRIWKATLDYFLKPGSVEKTVEKARASSGKAGGLPPRKGAIAADAATQAQVQKLSIPKLARIGGS
jgi:hypothetical protein